MNNYRVLVTGSSGFLGAATYTNYLRMGYDVIGIDILPSNTTDICDDVMNIDSHNLKDVDVVFHFAANVGGRMAIEHNFMPLVKNIEIDRVLFTWANKHAGRIVYPSSSAVYPIDQQTATNAIGLKEDMIDFSTNTIGVSDHIYGWCKLTAERMLWELHHTSDMKISIVRPFSGYGYGQSMDYPVPNLLNIVTTDPANITVWGTGLQSRDFVHITDIMRVFDWLLMDTSDYRVINIGSGITTNFIELLNIMHQELYGRDCDNIIRLLDKPVGVSNRFADTTLQKQLGILPTVSLSDGIKRMTPCMI